MPSYLNAASPFCRIQESVQGNPANFIGADPLALGLARSAMHGFSEGIVLRDYRQTRFEAAVR